MVLVLPICEKWFKMIKSGVKLEEYRSISPFYTKRLFYPDGTPKPIKWIEFRNGYGFSVPYFQIRLLGIERKLPKRGWCPDKFLKTKYYALKLGAIRNYKRPKRA